MMAGGVFSVLFIVGVWLLLSHFRTESKIEAALEDGFGQGSYQALEKAVKLQKEDGSKKSSKRARLELMLATLNFDHGSPAEGTPPEMLTSVDKELFEDSQMQVALVYRSLASGNLPFAKKAVLRLYRTPDEDGPLAEVFRARALVAQANHNLERALGDARGAVGENEDSPRHLALLATLQAQAGKVKAGLKTLELANPPNAPVALITQGLIYWQQERNHSAAAKAVAPLLEGTKNL